MLSISEIKTGKTIILNSEPYLVIWNQHSKMGRATAVMRTKLKNLITGSVIDKNFQGADKVEEAEITKTEAQFLYREGENYYFMENDNFEQFSLPSSVISESANYLVEGIEVKILYFSGRPINIELPVKMTFKVVDAPPSIKGNTVDGGSKQVTIETGIKITTPLFVKKGDIIQVNTQTGEYVERVN